MYQTYLYCKPNYYFQKFLNGNKQVKVKDFWKLFAVKQNHKECTEIYLFGNDGHLIKYITLNDKTLWKPIHVDDLLTLANFIPIYELKQGTRTQYRNKYEVINQLHNWYKEIEGNGQSV